MSWRDKARGAVPLLFWLITLAGLTAGVVTLVAVIVGR